MPEPAIVHNMILSFTLFRYLSLRTLFWFCICTMVLLLLGVAIEAFPVSKEVVRLNGGLNVAILLLLLKMPNLLMQTLPFIVLFGTILTLIQSSETQELTVIRASGFSHWQFLQPIFLITLGLSVLAMFVLDPLNTRAQQKYDAIVHQGTGTGSINTSIAQNVENGFWFREKQNGKTIVLQSLYVKNATGIDGISENIIKLIQPFMLIYDVHGQFERRIDAPRAFLGVDTDHNRHVWTFSDAIITLADSSREEVVRYEYPTGINSHTIRRQFLSATAIPLWNLPAQIRLARSSGLAPTEYLIRLYELLALPVLLLAMMLIAAAFGLPRGRITGPFAPLAWGCFTGFLFLIMEIFVSKLSALELIPHLFAAWVPSLAAILGATTLLIFAEG